MSKKSVIISFLSMTVFSVFCSYCLVFGVNASSGSEIFTSFKLSNNVYPDSLYLKNVMIAFESNIDLSNYKINTECNTFSKLSQSKENIYLFELKFFDNECDQKYFFLEDENGNKKKKLYFNIISDYSIYSELIDYDTTTLKKLENLLIKKQENLSKYDSYDNNGDISYFEFLKKNRLFNEMVYNKNLVTNILEAREEKYIVPVKGKELPTNPSKIPNSSRLYRADYTDGIHHGWDFPGDLGEQIISIDDGIIIRVVDTFNSSKLQNIIKGDNLPNEQKIKNLDILRGKQVWLKTMKGDVVFYSHLNDIYTNITEGTIVHKGQAIGTIGVTGIPDDNYTDYHVHVPIHKNPYNNKLAGQYDFDDYMNWDWYFKGKSTDYVLENQRNLFE